ncbi:hypothetical protein CEXT_27591 [Caerostris extrusa]|uniref:Uncharacterized protein n=1 Tax=Caerostris extrusa TaxID=172846 RepID=A0AAV4XTC3_CAEEX|nr:hypothetical protein CEXT_27591 [Caerostris extrusa]
MNYVRNCEGSTRITFYLIRSSIDVSEELLQLQICVRWAALTMTREQLDNPKSAGNHGPGNGSLRWMNEAAVHWTVDGMGKGSAALIRRRLVAIHVP